MYWLSSACGTGALDRELKKTHTVFVCQMPAVLEHLTKPGLRLDIAGESSKSVRVVPSRKALQLQSLVCILHHNEYACTHLQYRKSQGVTHGQSSNPGMQLVFVRASYLPT